MTTTKVMAIALVAASFSLVACGGAEEGDQNGGEENTVATEQLENEIHTMDSVTAVYEQNEQDIQAASSELDALLNDL